MHLNVFKSREDHPTLRNSGNLPASSPFNEACEGVRLIKSVGGPGLNTYPTLRVGGSKQCREREFAKPGFIVITRICEKESLVCDVHIAT